MRAGLCVTPRTRKRNGIIEHPKASFGNKPPWSACSKAGYTIITAGDEAGEMYLLASGRVGVVVTLDSGAHKRLATFSPGMAFGEMAMIDRQRRSANIVTDTDVECLRLPLVDFDNMDRTQPVAKIKLLKPFRISSTLTSIPEG